MCTQSPQHDAMTALVALAEGLADADRTAQRVARLRPRSSPPSTAYLDLTLRNLRDQGFVSQTDGLYAPSPQGERAAAAYVQIHLEDIRGARPAGFDAPAELAKIGAQREDATTTYRLLVASRTDPLGRARMLYAAADPERDVLYLSGPRKPNALYWVSYTGTLSPGRKPTSLFDDYHPAVQDYHS